MTDSPAIRHSLNRLEKAREALSKLEDAKTLKDAESAWSDLLLAGNGVYTKLEQGSKVNGKATAWFGRMKKVRKDDPLLSYMHHARNSEEHGIEDVTVRMDAGQATLTIREPFDPVRLEGLEIRVETDSRGHVCVSSSNEDLIATKMFDKPELALIRVKDPRFSDHFDPPFEHLGQKLAGISPSAIGNLFVDYLAKLIDEARGFGV